MYFHIVFFPTMARYHFYNNEKYIHTPKKFKPKVNLATGEKPD